MPVQLCIFFETLDFETLELIFRLNSKISQMPPTTVPPLYCHRKSLHCLFNLSTITDVARELYRVHPDDCDSTCCPQSMIVTNSNNTTDSVVKILLKK